VDDPREAHVTRSLELSRRREALPGLHADLQGVRRRVRGACAPWPRPLPDVHRSMSPLWAGVQRRPVVSAGVDAQVCGLIRDCLRGTNLTGLIREGRIYGSVDKAVNAFLSTRRESILRRQLKRSAMQRL